MVPARFCKSEKNISRAVIDFMNLSIGEKYLLYELSWFACTKALELFASFLTGKT